MNLSDHLEKVRYFQAVCEAGTFRKAALTLRLSQSAITVSVRKLEDSVGSPLLIRTKRGVRPTEAGETLLAFARELSFRVEDVEARLKVPGDGDAGRLRLGAYDSIAVYWLPQVLRHLHETFPHVGLSVSIGSSVVLSERVRSGELDLAIAVAPPHDSRLCISPLFRDRFSFYRAPKASMDLGFVISMFSARISRSETLASVLHARQFELGDALPVESFEVAKALALEGVGTAILPHRVAEFGPTAKRLVRVPRTPHAFGAHEICLIALSDTNAQSRLVRRVSAEMRSLTP